MIEQYDKRVALLFKRPGQEVPVVDGTAFSLLADKVEDDFFVGKDEQEIASFLYTSLQKLVGAGGRISIGPTRLGEILHGFRSSIRRQSQMGFSKIRVTDVVQMKSFEVWLGFEGKTFGIGLSKEQLAKRIQNRKPSD